MNRIFQNADKEKINALVTCIFVVILVTIAFNQQRSDSSATSMFHEYFCDDGTQIGDCSVVHPNILCGMNGTLVVNCAKCGCPKGYKCGSDNNCYSCEEGLVLGKDLKCHMLCGETGNYCLSGICFHGDCVACQDGYSLHVDGKCYLD